VITGGSFLTSINEMTELYESLDEVKYKDFIGELKIRKGIDKKIVGLGAGRMGYSLRAFIMRLGHIGYDATFIGDTVVPRVGSGDLVIVNSSSGSTPTIALLASQAKDAGATIISVCSSSDTPIGKLSSVCLTYGDFKSKQMMKTAFEQFTFVLFDAMAHDIVKDLQLDARWISYNHSILE